MANADGYAARPSRDAPYRQFAKEIADARLQTICAALLLLSLLFAAACSPNPEPQVQVRLVYPPLPPTVCARKPTAPPVEADDRAWALHKKADSDAGDDCRDRLDAVDRLVRSWMQPPAED
jgi:hypothetical protein